jgi:hypothetical protein
MAQYTFDPTQGKIVPLEQARVVTYITDNPDGLPSSAATGKTTATAQAAADKKARIELDPDVIAAKKLQAEAEAEVAATAASKTEAEASLAGTKAVNTINEILNNLEPDLISVDTKDVADENPPLRTVKFRTPKYNPINGKLTGYEITYSDGTVEFEAVETGEEDPDETDVTTTTYTAPDGTIFTNLDLYNAYIGKLKSDEKRQRGQSAYELLYEEFDRYGLASLVKDVEEFIKDGLSKAELTLKLRGTKTYQTRFKANADRVKNGLAAISEAEYIGLEDQYQNIMRNYGLPESYYARSKDGFGTQIGFQKFIANDVSATELEERVMAGQERVLNSNPEVLEALRSFYPGINNGDVLAYTLDPTNALTEIKRKITSAEIGGAALQAGLKTTLTRADELSQAGITKAVAQQGFETVAGGAPRGGQLASIYGQDPYTQTTAETEVFGLSGKTEAAKQRKKVTGLEKATFGGQSGATSTALVRDRAGAY